MSEEKKATKYEIEQKLKEIEKDAIRAEVSIFIPTERMVDVKAKLFAYARTENLDPKEISRYYKLPEIAGVSKDSVTKWFKKPGFTQWFYTVEEFQTWIDERATAVARRLYQLAMEEKGNAAVAAAKAFLELTSFKKTKIEIKDEFANMNDEELDRAFKQSVEEAKKSGILLDIAKGE